MIAALVLCAPLLAGCDPGTGAILGASLDRLGDQVNDAVTRAGVAADVAVIRAGSELDRAIENAKVAWQDVLDTSLDRVDKSIYQAYQDLDQMVRDLTSSAEQIVTDVGDRAQLLANTIPFANRSPQVREHTRYFVVGATRHRTEPTATAEATGRWVVAALGPVSSPPGWSINPDSARVVIDSQSDEGVFSARITNRTSTSLTGMISAERFAAASPPASITAHLAWEEVRDPANVELKFEGNFFHAGDTSKLPTLIVAGQRYPAAEAIETGVLFEIPEAAFGGPTRAVKSHQVTLEVPYLSGVLKREKMATYQVTVAQLPTQPGSATLYTWPTQTLVDRQSRSAGSGSEVDSNYVADGSERPQPFEFPLATADEAAHYVIDPASVRVVADNHVGKWTWRSIGVDADSIGVEVTAYNCSWYKIDCPDGRIRFHVEYEIVRAETGPAPIPMQRQIDLEWGQHIDVPVPDDDLWQLVYMDVKGVPHELSVSNYTDDKFVRITMAPTAVVFSVKDPASVE